MPPDPNCDANDTDEDSGNDGEINRNNLPGSQLRSAAEIRFRRNVAVSLLQLYGINRNNSLTRRLNRPSPLQNVESRFDRIEHYVVEEERQTRCRVCHKKVSTKCLKCEEV
ncbi:hypothetical protein RN001_003323 [Aquatica leii]|uniref:Uncharacterized protein n=1 Tax=Aquatica leii TaxID=1421715 RepID=A0AAN7PI54_9COLE|nr:hypothetical protein RN001_003323 [Aquatica leii]